MLRINLLDWEEVRETESISRLHRAYDAVDDVLFDMRDAADEWEQENEMSL